MDPGSRKIWWLACMVSVACLSGCGSERNPRGYIGINGTVRFDGQPMTKGEVLFLPTSSAQLIAGAPVKNGRFVVPPARGLPPGEYRVFFTVLEETDRIEADPDPAGGARRSQRNIVAADWAADTSTQKIVIEKGASVASFDFDVPREKAAR